MIPVNQRLVRDINQSIILQTIQENAPISRIDIVKKTGLAPSTVSTLIADLQAKGIVRECGFADSSGGRKPVLVQVNPTGGFFLAVDLGGSKISVGVLDLAANLLKRWVYTTPVEGGEAVFKTLMKALTAARKWCNEQGIGLLGLGVCSSGIVDSARGVVIRANNLGWDHFPLQERLRETIQMNCVVEHDTNAAAYGEFVYGAAHGHANVAYVSIGTGIGAGLIIGGRLYTGSGGIAGEIGHVTAVQNGPKCKCGKQGCLEAVASGPAIAHTYEKLCGIEGLPHIDAKWVINEAERGNERCRDIVLSAGKHIGTVIGNMVNVLNLDCVVLGGGVVGSEGSVMFSAIYDGIQESALPQFRGVLHVKKATRGVEAGLVGVAALTLNKVLLAGSERAFL